MVAKKQDIKVACFHMTRRWINKKREEHSTMKYVEENWGEKENNYHRWKHKWWLKAKVEGIFLNHRLKGDHQQQICPMCREDVETLEHFLWNCQALGRNELWLKLPMPLIRSEVILTKWMLSGERSEKEKEEVSDIVIKRWKERCKKIQKENENNEKNEKNEKNKKEKNMKKNNNNNKKELLVDDDRRKQTDDDRPENPRYDPNPNHKPSSSSSSDERPVPSLSCGGGTEGQSEEEEKERKRPMRRSARLKERRTK